MSSGWARSLLRFFAAGGVRDVVTSPGARSAPLAFAAERTPDLRVHPIVDERSASFFALGIARATGVPPLVVCTSGTAGGHALPAVLEADRSNLPLIVVTADRPPELHDCGAPQTVDQVGLFGRHVRHFVDLGPPDPATQGSLARVAAQCVLASRWPTPGPVHVNARFRDPLAVSELGPTQDAPLDVFVPRSAPSEVALDALEAAVRSSERGLIACGAAHSPAVDAPRLAALCGYPIFAEATSQLRRLDGPFCPGLDAILRAPAFRSGHVPELVLQIGMPPISAGWSAALDDWRRSRRFVVSAHGWPDPAGNAAMVIADPSDVVAALADRLARRRPFVRRSSEWLDEFERADEIAWVEVARVLDRRDGLVEGHVARAVAAALPAGSLLALGSSLPLRDIDTFARALHPSVRVLHQRGANGIDGLVAAASGAQVASGRPVTLLCGDLSLLHDVGSLALAARAPGPLVIVVVQNGGGRIFDELPFGCPPASLERCFTMPHGLDLSHAAALFGLAHARVDAPGALERALAAAEERRGATLIEALVDPAQSSAARRAVWAGVAARLESLVRE
ncbi:MAG: 2-succinyl-5-enolpyruvyl-6-hydroxy-3-cyclohexene-1-carboxylic-acid synthase [Deltaproteobacteria bacterium]|nr:2-succinyl-5-enolpyruvyl-6-hydroxy-3-cyclohexene-1-carboxylic-acid synthase [Deltaproteobacteria bacterium]